MTLLLSAGESWRVAALTMMQPEALSAALSGEDAFAWVTAAAACGIAEAQLRLGRMRLEGDNRNHAAAFAHFRDAAAQGNIEARNMLGRCFENGWGTQKDSTAAAREYAMAADAGLDWAQYNLGHMLLSGNGVAPDAAAAFDNYGKAAAQGHVRAMNLVGRCHEQGWGTQSDRRAACSWYRRSAKGGYFRGAYNYAGLLAEKNCLNGAQLWFSRALAWAPEPSRSNMVLALARHKNQALRALIAL